jgi:hypothetical protein
VGFKLKVKISGKFEAKNNSISQEFLSEYFSCDSYDLELRMTAKWGGPLSLRLSKNELIDGNISMSETKKVVCFTLDAEYSVNWQGNKFKKTDFTEATQISLHQIIGIRKHESKFGDATYHDAIYVEVVKSEILNISIK